MNTQRRIFLVCAVLFCCAGAAQAQPRFVDNGDGTVTDNDTGLQWEKKDAADGVPDFGNPHDVDNTYPWSDFIKNDGSGFLDGVNSCSSVDGLALAGGLGGRCDWRLPTIAELRTILPASAPCATPKRIFITSQAYDGDLGGLAGADAKCQALADAAALTGTYKAWLSNATVSAASRLTHSSGNYVLVDGTVAAAGWAGLTSGTLQHAIDRTELNNPVSGGVQCAGTFTSHSMAWTNTAPDGSIGGNTANDSCDGDWSSSGGGIFGRSGHVTATDSNWTVSCPGAKCLSSSALYCLEQSGPCIDPILGPTGVSHYWSNTNDPNTANYAWRAIFDDGTGVDSADKITPSYVRAVRGGCFERCDDHNPCTVDSCVGVGGTPTCQYVPLADGAPCRVNACQEFGTCTSGTCTPGACQVGMACLDCGASCIDDPCRCESTP